jgi:hypothetical protein
VAPDRWDHDVGRDPDPGGHQERAIVVTFASSARSVPGACLKSLLREYVPFVPCPATECLSVEKKKGAFFDFFFPFLLIIAGRGTNGTQTEDITFGQRQKYNTSR